MARSRASVYRCQMRTNTCGKPMMYCGTVWVIIELRVPGTVGLHVLGKVDLTEFGKIWD